jgi:hypothetical protein
MWGPQRYKCITRHNGWYSLSQPGGRHLEQSRQSSHSNQLLPAGGCKPSNCCLRHGLALKPTYSASRHTHANTPPPAHPCNHRCPPTAQQAGWVTTRQPPLRTDRSCRARREGDAACCWEPINMQEGTVPRRTGLNGTVRGQQQTRHANMGPHACSLQAAQQPEGTRWLHADSITDGSLHDVQAKTSSPPTLTPQQALLCMPPTACEHAHALTQIHMQCHVNTPHPALWGDWPTLSHPTYKWCGPGPSP